MHPADLRHWTLPALCQKSHSQPPPPHPPFSPLRWRRSFNITFSLTELKDLNTFLESRSYVVGYTASATDAALFAALGKAPDAKKFANVARFYSHLASFTPEARAALPAHIGGGVAGGAVAPAAKAAGKPAEEEEEADLFGDDGDAAAAKVKAAAAAPVAAAGGGAKPAKAKPIAKSICVYDVKPNLATTKPAEIEAGIRSIKMDGLQWGEVFKVENVGFGIQKLVIQFVCEDEKVSLTDLEELMMNIGVGSVIDPDTNELLKDDETGDVLGLIQSVDQLSMNKVRERRRRARGACLHLARTLFLLNTLPPPPFHTLTLPPPPQLG